MLAALRDDMMQPEVVEVFVAEYIRERNRLSRQRDASRDERDAELRGVTAGVERLKAAILNGVDASLFAVGLTRMGRRKAKLEAEMAACAEDVVPALLHPRLAQLYRDKVERLLQAFDAEGTRSEAQEIVRSLIDAVAMTPEDGVLNAEVKSDLTTTLALASETKQQIKLVAGTGFEPVTFRL